MGTCLSFAILYQLLSLHRYCVLLTPAQLVGFLLIADGLEMFSAGCFAPSVRGRGPLPPPCEHCSPLWQACSTGQEHSPPGSHPCLMSEDEAANRVPQGQQVRRGAAEKRVFARQIAFSAFCVHSASFPKSGVYRTYDSGDSRNLPSMPHCSCCSSRWTVSAPHMGALGEGISPPLPRPPGADMLMGSSGKCFLSVAPSLWGCEWNAVSRRDALGGARSGEF